MAITYVGVGSSTAATVTIPAHAVGDLMVVVAFRTSSTTAPGIPGGWTSTHSTGSGGVPSVTVGWKIATATNDASGTWTNANFMIALVYRGATGLGGAGSTRAASSSYSCPAITMSNATGSSWVIRAAYNTSDSIGTAPAGHTLRGYNTRLQVFDTNGGVTSAGSATLLQTSGSAARGVTLEILAADNPEGTGSGSYTWSSAAAGKRTPKATNSSSYTWAGSAVGKSNRAATAGTSTYTWAASATGKRAPKATTSGAYQFETTSAGDTDYQGIATGTYQWALTSATGVTPVTDPTATGTYGWTSTKVGYSPRKATTTSGYTWAASATGKRTPKGLATTGNYTWASTAFAATPRKATTTSTYTWAGEASGHQTGNGLALSSYHWTATATGLFIPKPVPGVVGWIAE